MIKPVYHNLVLLPGRIVHFSLVLLNPACLRTSYPKSGTPYVSIPCPGYVTILMIKKSKKTEKSSPIPVDLCYTSLSKKQNKKKNNTKQQNNKNKQKKDRLC